MIDYGFSRTTFMQTYSLIAGPIYLLSCSKRKLWTKGQDLQLNSSISSGKSV